MNPGGKDEGRKIIMCCEFWPFMKIRTNRQLTALDQKKEREKEKVSKIAATGSNLQNTLHNITDKYFI